MAGGIRGLGRRILRGVIGTAEQRVKRKRIKQARLEVIERGKKPVSSELIRKILQSINNVEIKKLEKIKEKRSITEADKRDSVERVSKKIHRTLVRISVKIALDRTWIVNTKADPNRRQKIHKIMEEGGIELSVLRDWGKSIKDKRYKDRISETIEQITELFGSKRKASEFTKHFLKAAEEIKEIHGNF